MALREWLSKDNVSVATVADLEVVTTGNLHKQSIVSYEDLINHYPAMIEGCLLSDILTFVIEEDYEQLMTAEVMICLAKTLRDDRKIATVATLNPRKI